MFSDDSIIKRIKKNTRFDSFWTEEDDWVLRREIHALRTQLLQAYEDYDDVNDEADLVLDDDLDDYIESLDSLSIDIDSILTFNLDDMFSYTKYDSFFFLITLWIILLNGFMFFGLLYIFCGIHMAFNIDYDEEDAREMDKYSATHDFCVKVFYLLDKVIEEYDPIIEPINFDEDTSHYYNNSLMFNYTNIGLSYNDNHLFILKKDIYKDYNYFIKIYYDFLIILIANRKDNFLNYKFYNFIKIYNLHLNYNNNLNANYNLYTSYQLSEYHYNLLYKDIKLSSNFKLSPYNYGLIYNII